MRHLWLRRPIVGSERPAHGAGSSVGRDYGSARDPHGGTSTAGGRVLDRDFATMLLDQAVDDCETQPGSCGLGGGERFEETLDGVAGQPLAGILDGYDGKAI